MRFTPVNDDSRTFVVQRRCFRGSVDGWINLRSAGSRGLLRDLVETICPHIGQESFFELYGPTHPTPFPA